MGQMQDLHITIHNGGDEAVAAVERIGKEWREQLERAASEIDGMRLTDQEREAIIVASIELNALHMFDTNHAASLRGLLERLS
jgi:hypothetical protein